MNKNYSILFKLMLITLFFNIWFPKAGIKLAGIPLTVGNILFAILFICWSLLKIRTKKMEFTKIHLYVLIGIYYFIIKFLICYLNNYSISDMIEYIVPLIVYPLILFVCVDLTDSQEKFNSILKMIYYGFIFLSIYGLIQYMFGLEKTTIPGVTVNLSDYLSGGSEWYLSKNNGTGDSNSKIFSTYQNGNLLGVNLILFFPLVFEYAEKKGKNFLSMLLTGLFAIVIFLTLSRACWLGVFLFILLKVLFNYSRTKEKFIYKNIFVFISILGIVLIFKYFPSIASRLSNTTLDKLISMSGRTEGFIELFKSIWRSNNVFSIIFGPYGIIKTSGFAYEMTQIAIFSLTGIVGLVLWIIPLISIVKNVYKNSGFNSSINLSIIIWFIVAIIEGSYWLPPTAFNLFLIISLGIIDINMNKQKLNQEI